MKRILAIIDDVYEDLELWVPKIRAEEDGHEVVVAAPEAGRSYAGKHGYPCANKPIAHICHAGWILISAKILDGRRATSTVGIKDDMENAGATWIDEALVIDGNQISSRTPKDLAVFAKAFADALA